MLRPFFLDYEPFHEEFHWLFDSYYISLGEEIPEKQFRASFSRPSLEQIIEFRSHVDHDMETLLNRSVDDEMSRRILLGLNHEQQHQELALTDIKHAFFSNPLQPSYRPAPLAKESGQPVPQLSWHDFSGGLVEIGSQLSAPLDFCFDNETPRHKVYLRPFQIANRTVTCREYLEFMSDDGYRRPRLWLADGWRRQSRLGCRRRFTGNGMRAMRSAGEFSH